MRLTEFGKVIGKGQGQEAGPTFKSVFGRKPISLATVPQSLLQQFVLLQSLSQQFVVLQSLPQRRTT